MRLGIYITVWVAWMLVGSCTPERAQTNEGYIKYRIAYRPSTQGKALAKFLPGELMVLFKDNKSLIRIEGDWNLFSLHMLSIPESDSSYTILRLVDKRYVYKAGPGEPAFGVPEMGQMQVRYLNETREIAGCMCNKAVASSSNLQYEPQVVYYTYEIGLEQPNAHNPYKDIDGVLMQFAMQVEGIDMGLEAFQVTHQPIGDEFFVPPPDAVVVSYDEMQKLLHMFD